MYGNGNRLKFGKSSRDREFHPIPLTKPYIKVSPHTALKMMPLSYKKPVAFYKPKYEVPSERNSATPDLRTTIHRDPQVRTDSTDRAQVTFFTADRNTPYEVVLEGVTDNGEVCRAVTTLERK